MKDVNAELQIADAIREIRARGCTTPGIAELIVEYHGALHVLSNLDRTQQLGETLAKDAESPLGVKMRALLSEAATKEVKAEPSPIVDLTERAVQHVMKAGYSEDAARQIVAEHGADTVLAGEQILADEKEEAVKWLMEAHEYSEPTAREIVEKEGVEAILAEKRHKTSTPAVSQAAPDAGAGTGAGSAPDTAAGTSESEAAVGHQPATSPATEQTTKANEPNPNAAA